MEFLHVLDPRGTIKPRAKPSASFPGPETSTIWTVLLIEVEKDLVPALRPEPVADPDRRVIVAARMRNEENAEPGAHPCLQAVDSLPRARCSTGSWGIAAEVVLPRV